MQLHDVCLFVCCCAILCDVCVCVRASDWIQFYSGAVYNFVSF